MKAILTGYAAGTRYGIRADADGLLRAGVPGTQLTWMDAKVGDVVVTPRIGKPVEIQALWINALRIGGMWSARWRQMEARARSAFAARFPDPETGGPHDVVDADHVPGAVDARVRPNQVFAAGGLPFPILEGKSARSMVDLVEARLLTPLGLRSLAPGEAGYVPHYRGGPRERDGAYHQGTVWPCSLALLSKPGCAFGVGPKHRKPSGRRRGPASSNRSTPIWRPPGWGMSRRWRTPSRRTGRPAAHSRLGRWAN
ncbi:MAG: hypothetical protein JOY71_29820 [Acetobacteraceae bacterium]|nr:hypothetical protein [Acetobacteraceae bacterium]